MQATLSAAKRVLKLLTYSASWGPIFSQWGTNDSVDISVRARGSLGQEPASHFFQTKRHLKQKDALVLGWSEEPVAGAGAVLRELWGPWATSMECGCGRGREAEQALSHRTAPSLRTSSGAAVLGLLTGPVVFTQEEPRNVPKKLPAGIAVSA